MSEEPAANRNSKRKQPPARRAAKGGKYPEDTRLPAKIQLEPEVKVAIAFADIPHQGDRDALREALGASDEHAAELYDFLAPKIVEVAIKKLKRDATTTKRLKKKRLSPRLVAFMKTAALLTAELDRLTPVDKNDIQRLFIRPNKRRKAKWLEKRKLTTTLARTLQALDRVRTKIDRVDVPRSRPRRDEKLDEELAEILFNAWVSMPVLASRKKGAYYAFLAVVATRLRGEVSAGSYITRPKNLPNDQISVMNVGELHGPLKRAIKLLPAKFKKFSQELSSIKLQ
jgi:hypothetical protein